MEECLEVMERKKLLISNADYMRDMKILQEIYRIFESNDRLDIRGEVQIESILHLLIPWNAVHSGFFLRFLENVLDWDYLYTFLVLKRADFFLGISLNNGPEPRNMLVRKYIGKT